MDARLRGHDARRAALATLLLLGGCGLVGPDYEPPQVPTPIAYQAPLPEFEGDPALLARWWQGFDDPLLGQLIVEGLAANLDLQAAESRVRQARSRLTQAGAAAQPTVDLGGGAGADADLREGVLDVTGSANLGFDTSWEADLFGGIARSIEAAGAGLEAEKERRRAVLVSLTAEIGQTYVALRGAQRRLAFARSSLRLQRGTLDLVIQQRDAGIASDLDVVRARSSVAGVEAQLPGLQAAIDQAINRLSVLLGQPPGALEARLSEPEPIPVVVMGADAGLPADLVRRRPDLREAERSLAQSTAQIGVAVAELYPQLRLPGSLTFSRGGFGTGTIVDVVTAGLSASLSIPLFDAGARQAAVDEARLATGEALLQYRQQLLLALEEVENALIDYAEVRERRAALARALANDQQAYTLASNLYGEGLASFLDVLDAQRSLTASQQDLAQADTELSTRLIALYRALGGGWAETD